MKNYDELMTSISEKAKIKTMQRKRQKKLFLSSAISLYLLAVVSIGALNLAPNPLDIPQDSDTSLNSNSQQTGDILLKGLVVENFKVSDIQTQTGVEASRLGAMKLSDFFQYSYAPDMFVFVRILNTEQWEDKNDNHITLKQTSSAIVIEKVWSKNENVPENIVIEQSLNGGYMGDEKNNMLRKDGVYLLPLMKDKENEKWYVNFDLDVLFEVDNEGKIWSHSSFEKFNVYDGKDANVLSEDIIHMTSNENFSSATTLLGQMVVNWGDVGVLAEVTIATVERTEDKFGFACYKYTFDEFIPLLTSNNRNIGAISYTASNTVLEVGSKYLIMLDYSENGPYIENRRVAKINEDRTISPISNDSRNIFALFDDCTIEQITESAEKAIAWRNEFGEK